MMRTFYYRYLIQTILCPNLFRQPRRRRTKQSKDPKSSNMSETIPLLTNTCPEALTTRDVSIQVTPTDTWKTSVNVKVMIAKDETEQRFHNNNITSDTSARCNEKHFACHDAEVSMTSINSSTFSEKNREQEEYILDNQTYTQNSDVDHLVKLLLINSKEEATQMENGGVKQDEELVHDLVFNKFNRTLEEYKRKSLKRKLKRSNRTGSGYFSNDEIHSELLRQSISGSFSNEDTCLEPFEFTYCDYPLEPLNINLQTQFVESVSDIVSNSSFERTKEDELVNDTNSEDKGYVLHEEKKCQKFQNCISQTSECDWSRKELTYNSQEFMNNTLDDDYVPTDLTATRQTMEDLSIESSQLSQLISKDDSAFYSSSRYFPNSHMHRGEEQDSSGERLHQYNETDFIGKSIRQSNEKIDELMKLMVVHHQRMLQASKAIQLCKETKKFNCSLEHIESERLLLLSICKKGAVTEEIADMNYNKPSYYNRPKFGVVSIKNLCFPGRAFESKKKFSTWYVCIVSSGSEVFATVAKKANLDGNVEFHEEFEFTRLDSGFEITISLYGMRLPNKAKYNHRNLDTELNQNFTNCLNLAKIFASRTSSRSSVPPQNRICTSSFVLYGQRTIGIKDIDRTDFRMDQISRLSKLYGFLNASFKSKLNITESLKGFLSVGHETSSGIVWNRLWCCLEGKLIKCYTYPDHEEDDLPLQVLELDGCPSGAVRAKSRNVYVRSRTLLLEFLEDIEQLRFRIFLSADTVQEFIAWENCINRVVYTLKSWNCLKR